ncbi:hypothetical protein [Nocardia sp. NPDC052566]|uniref:DUF7257 domain-containing protein n=1 Tax=Nocardia sp. NPDC052566 TaxID=3364330 RepID=UPI0037C84212
MTSPDKKIPPGAYSGGSIRNLQKVTWESAQASVMSSVMGSFAGLDAVGTNLNTATNRAREAANSAQAGAAQAQSTAKAVQSTSASNASEIAKLKSEQTQNEVGGAAVSDRFDSWDTTKWTVAKWAEGSNAVPDIVVADGQAGITKSGNTGTGGDFALYKTPLMTDSQTVSIVLGRPNQASQFTGSGLLLRAAIDLSSFALAQIGTTKITLQRATLIAGKLEVTTWAEASSLTLSTGDTVSVSAAGDKYEVLVNGIVVLVYRDTAVSTPVGANNRWVGFFTACAITTGWAGATYFGFDVESLAAADTSSPPLVGTGWSLCRQSATTVAHAAGKNRFGAVFDTVRQMTNVNVVDLPSGSVQITKPGWYVMNVGAQWSKPCGTGYTYSVGLWTAPNPEGDWRLIRASGDVEGSKIYRVSGGFVVFAGAGSVWAPGYNVAGANDMYGDPSGINTYFDGSLCSFA